MQFTPKTEKEIIASKLFERGTYDFEVLFAWEKISKRASNPMIELRLRVSNDNGHTKTVTDYLVASNAEKLRHAALALGLLHKYDEGSLSENDFWGLKGRLKLGIEKGLNGCPDRNVVTDYVS